MRRLIAMPSSSTWRKNGRNCDSGNRARHYNYYRWNRTEVNWKWLWFSCTWQMIYVKQGQKCYNDIFKPLLVTFLQYIPWGKLTSPWKITIFTGKTQYTSYISSPEGILHDACRCSTTSSTLHRPKITSHWAEHSWPMFCLKVPTKSWAPSGKPTVSYWLVP